MFGEVKIMKKNVYFFWELPFWFDYYLFLPMNLYIVNSLLFLGFLIILIGIYGLLRKSLYILNILICLEVILLGFNMCILSFVLAFDNPIGFILIFFLLTLATAETAFGLGLMVLFFRSRYTNFINYFSLCKY
jgi:NADH-quinone oxidoreductase subunit K